MMMTHQRALDGRIITPMRWRGSPAILTRSVFRLTPPLTMAKLFAALLVLLAASVRRGARGRARRKSTGTK